MYLFIDDKGVIVDYALNERMALIDDTLIVDGQVARNPHPGTRLQYIPDQKIGWLYEDSPEGRRKEGLRYPDDVPILPTKDDLQAQVDYETEWGIHFASHAKAGVGEQIGILRVQIAEILVALGLEPTEEFAKLNAVAAEKIQEARKKKEGIDAKDSRFAQSATQ